MKGFLSVSEHFANYQGEGRTVGVPSVFWRFQHCGFNCTWCDTVEVWKKGKDYSYENLFNIFNEAGYFERLTKKSHHLILTGGDPLIQQRNILDFIEYCRDRHFQPVHTWYVECENQGQLLPSLEFCEFVKLWNVSPKLSNSGVSAKKRFNDAFMERVRELNVIYKFPVKTWADVLEVKSEWQERYALPSHQIYLMPVCDTRAEHIRIGPAVAEMAADYGYYFSPRLHILLHDQKTGV